MLFFLLKTGPQILLPLELVVSAGIAFVLVLPVCFLSDFIALILKSLCSL